MVAAAFGLRTFFVIGDKEGLTIKNRYVKKIKMK